MNLANHFLFRLSISVITIACLGCVNAVAQQPGEPVRTWKDQSGKYSVQARLERIDVDQVVLRKTDGSVVRVPIDRLSQDDRKYIESRSSKTAGGANSGNGGNGLSISASISRQEPFDLIIFPDVERQKPIYVTVTIKGPQILDAKQYGKFKFDSITDDKGNKLKLLLPLKGKFNEELEKGMVRLDHFFLEKPNTLTLHLVVSNPSAGANEIKIDGSFYLDIQPAITIKDVLKNLNQPLKAPGLEKIGQFVPLYPKRGESDVEGSLAIDFTGDRRKIDTIELLNGDGMQISTGGTGSGSSRKARIIRWAGEKLPADTQLRVVLEGDSKNTRIPISLKNVVIDPRKAKAKPSSQGNQTKPGNSNSGQKQMAQRQGNKPVNNQRAPVNIAVEFFNACRQGKLDIVKKHLQKYPSLNRRKDPRWRETAFSKACWNGQLKVIEYLLEHGADIDARAGDLVTPLHQAARQGQLETVKFLLEKGADKSLKDNKGKTASDMAKSNGHDDVVRAIDE